MPLNVLIAGPDIIDSKYHDIAKPLIERYGKNELLRIVHFGCMRCGCRCNYGKPDLRKECTVLFKERNGLLDIRNFLAKKLEKYEETRGGKSQPPKD